jgi:hypothetical protein
VSGIVERLRAGTGGGKHWMLLHEEAADEITRLTAFNSSLTDKGNSYIVDNARLTAELEACRVDADRLDWLIDRAVDIIMRDPQHGLKSLDRDGIDSARGAT